MTEINLRSGIVVKKGASKSAIVIETNEGKAKLTATELEKIVRLNNKLGAQSFAASIRIRDFLAGELA